MATYVNDLRLTELATGEGSGTWGVTTNTNLELIGEALGYGTQDCFASDADATTTVADGASDPARAMYFKVTSSATLTATRTLTIGPNTVSRVMLIENATTGSQSIAISQGSGGNVTIANGAVKMVYLDGAGAGAAVVDALADLELGTITVANLTATTADINGGTIDGATIGGASAAAGTFTTLNATGGGALTGTWSDLGTVTTVDINGGTIDGATIGGASAGAGTFTNLTASGTVSFSGATVSDGGTVTTVNIDGGSIDGTIIGAASPAAGTFTTVTGTGFASTGDMTFGDNDKAIFGAGSDLQIYHDGSASYIKDAGTGNLNIQTDGVGVVIEHTDGTNLAVFNAGDGTASLYNSGNLKLATTATGIDVTGTVTADGLTVDGATLLNNGTNSTHLTLTGTTNRGLTISTTNTGGQNDSGAIYDAQDTAGGGVGSHEFRIGGESKLLIAADGDISFYEDTGTTPKFFWDASAESLGIGTTSPNATLALDKNTATQHRVLDLENNSITYSMYIDQDNASTNSWSLFDTTNSQTALRYLPSSSGYWQFYTNDTERMRIDSSGNLLVGQTSSSTGNVNGSIFFGGADAGIAYLQRQTGTDQLRFYVGGNRLGYLNTASSTVTLGTANYPLAFATNDTERMRIDSSGNLLVGQTSPDSNSVGIGLLASGTAYAVRSGAAAFIAHRKSSDGNIVDFYKDNTAVGSIAADVGFLRIGTGDTNLLFANTGGDRIIPRTGAGSAANGTVSLGDAGSRFKDLYLSGGVIASASSGNSAHTFTATANNTRATLTTDAKTTAGVQVQGVLGSYGDASKVDIGTLSNHATAFITNNTEVARFDTSGNLLVGCTNNTSSHIAVFDGSIGVVSNGNSTRCFQAFLVSNENWNVSDTAVRVGRDGTTSRSINAGGTVNASGADYAEYMTKAGDFSIAKGDVCGINVDGKLTNVYADAIAFVVKSTDPSYVGGDRWGDGLDEEALEQARQRVDRIAFSGQVPVNVLGATPGDYIVPQQEGEGIIGVAVSNPTFEQYMTAVGKVIAIEDDGRALIIVKVS